MEPLTICYRESTTCLTVISKEVGDNVIHVCHICNVKITDELKYALVSTTGIYALCNYCQEEQVVIFEEDEDAQDEGLLWAKKLLEKI